MNSPDIKIIALSNVFTKSMHFKEKGDVTQGHTHTYDHATMVSAGAVLVEFLNDQEQVISAKVFSAPGLIYVPKDVIHRLTALENNTVCACIHALRTIDEEIISPESFVEQVTDWEYVKHQIYEKYGIPFLPLLQKNLKEQNEL
jgi:cupin superfamily acireductone dioxygenase involved in methionine salvage